MYYYHSCMLITNAPCLLIFSSDTCACVQFSLYTCVISTSIPTYQLLLLAVLSVTSSSFVELNLVDVLYQMLRDRDSQVVSNCISALSEILAAEGGMVVNVKITNYLLSRSVPLNQ